jgi:hypothetical protein
MPPTRTSRITDWAGQGEWMVGTSVAVVSAPPEGNGPGTRLEAVTGRAPLAVRDDMVVTEWDPPRRCTVDHLGSVVTGRGIIEVFTLPGGRSRLVWTEELLVPLGALGAIAWPVAGPASRAGFVVSLRRFATRVGAAHHGG